MMVAHRDQISSSLTELVRGAVLMKPSTAIYPLSQRYGGFYTQEEIKDVIEFTTWHRHHSQVMYLAHCRAAVKSLHIWLKQKTPLCTGVQLLQRQCHNCSAGNYEFIDKVPEEIPALFLYDTVVRDEVPNGVWSKSPACQAFMEELKFSDYKELQGHFLRMKTNFANWVSACWVGKKLNAAIRR